MTQVKTDYLFLYGTLNPEHAPREVRAAVKKLELVSEATMSGVLYDLGEYPGAVFSSDSHGREIRGKIFRLPLEEQLLPIFDKYEEYNPADPSGSLFRREIRDAYSSDGRRIHCWVYSYNRGVGPAREISNGDFLTYRAKHPIMHSSR